MKLKRTVQTHLLKKRKKCIEFRTSAISQKLTREILNSEDSGNNKQEKSYNIFSDEKLNTFFRRFDFSPDGSIVAIPAGISSSNNEKQDQHAVYLYTRNVLRNKKIKEYLRMNM